MKISLIMATYNGESFIEEQLKSIYNQSHKIDEVKIFDDCSTDRTVEIVNKFINNYQLNDNWTIVKNSYNKGYAKNFIEGAMELTGDLIFFCDQDDIWCYDKVESMIKVFEKNNKVDLLCSNLEPFYCDKDTRKWSKKDLKFMKETGEVEFPILNSFNFHLRRSGCTMCIKREFLKEIKMYWIDDWAHDDFVWKFAMLKQSCAILQKITVKRRMHANNTTVVRLRTREKRIKQLEESNKQYSSLNNYLVNNNNDEYLKILNKNINSINTRLKVIKEKSIIAWLKLLIFYRDCYPRIKGLFLDLYFSIFQEYKGV